MTAFFEALCEVAGGADTAVAALRAVPLVIVLDGLEVLQEPRGESGLDERPGRLAHGEFLEPDLREFLDAACRLEHGGLVLLTSRFPFRDLNHYLGTSMRLLPLGHLTAEGGAELLASLGVEGSVDDREAVARRLEGHPLALRVFAAAAADQSALGEDDLLHEKVTKLLASTRHRCRRRSAHCSGWSGRFLARWTWTRWACSPLSYPAWQTACAAGQRSRSASCWTS